VGSSLADQERLTSNFHTKIAPPRTFWHRLQPTLHIHLVENTNAACLTLLPMVVHSPAPPPPLPVRTPPHPARWRWGRDNWICMQTPTVPGIHQTLVTLHMHADARVHHFLSTHIPDLGRGCVHPSLVLCSNVLQVF
jgi:hypothetical protein